MADDVPYVDPNAVGFIGLCDANDQSIDHGHVADLPFVRTAVSSVAAIAPYDGDGRTATLFAFQPREGTTPREWSGQALTAATRYDDPAHPTAVGTSVDDSLATFIGIYPPQWNGLIQLRLYLSVSGQPALTQQYAATDIEVDGDSWKVVRGGNTPCNSSAAHSLEELLPPGTGQANTPATPVVAESTDQGSGTSTWVKVAIGALLVAAVISIGVVIVRRRGKSAAPPDDSDIAPQKPVRSR